MNCCHGLAAGVPNGKLRFYYACNLTLTLTPTVTPAAGVDNGKLWFDHVRVPRQYLLDAFSQVAPDGAFTSSIAKPRDRFLKVSGGEARLGGGVLGNFI